MKGSIELFSEDVEFEYKNKDQLTDWINQVLVKEGQSAHYINIIFCNDSYLLKINQDYLGHDYYTDIVTFQYDHDRLEGELFISIDRVRENASELEVDFTTELNRVIIHGILHLLGYKDKTHDELAIMRSKEDEYLSMVNFHSKKNSLDRF